MRVEAPFKVGDRIRHPVFGDGLVLEVSARGEDFALRVSFSKDGAQLRSILENISKVFIEDRFIQPVWQTSHLSSTHKAVSQPFPP